MSNLNQFLGEPAVTSIVSYIWTTPTIFFSPTSMTAYSNCRGALSGSVTANTLVTALSISGGGGYLDLLAISSVDATSRTHRIKITMDGVVVFDTTSGAVTAANRGFSAIGIYCNNAGGEYSLGSDPKRFNSSCLVEYASSVTETDKTNIFYAYSLT